MEPEILTREFNVQLSRSDGRTVDLRIVPYNTPTQVSDGGPAYTEEWLDGVFDDQLKAANRVDVLLNFEHLSGIGNVIGRGVHLESLPDGMYGSFRISDTQDGDKALELINADVLTGASLEAVPKVSRRSSTGIVQRVKAHLRNVALCRNGAYKTAGVLAVRVQHIPHEFLPQDIDPNLLERCRQLGFQLPGRYTAHPEQGTPEPSGTPA